MSLEPMKTDLGMRIASALAIEGLSEVVRNADVAVQHDFLSEYEKTMCDSASGVVRSADGQLEFGDFVREIPKDF